MQLRFTNKEPVFVPSLFHAAKIRRIIKKCKYFREKVMVPYNNAPQGNLEDMQ